jgi:hypothetical protein
MYKFVCRERDGLGELCKYLIFITGISINIVKHKLQHMASSWLSLSMSQVNSKFTK